MSVLDTVGMINKATGFNPPPAPASPPVAPVLQQINRATGFPPAQPTTPATATDQSVINNVNRAAGFPPAAARPMLPMMAPMQLFHQTFSGADPNSEIEARNQQIMLQNEQAIQSGQYHMLQPLQMLTPAKKLPIFTNK